MEMKHRHGVRWNGVIAMINEIKLTLTDLRTTRLMDLRKGKVFMKVRDFYLKSTDVYMVIKNDYKMVTVVRLSDGETVMLDTKIKVLELTVTLDCELKSHGMNW